MKILLLNDGQKFNNWGIQSTTQSLRKILQQLYTDGVEFSSLPHSLFVKKYRFDPEIFGKKIFNRNSRLKKYLGEVINLPIYADEISHVEEYWLSCKLNSLEVKIKSMIQNADLVVFNAEGSVYRSNKSAITGLFLLYLAGKMRKSTLFCNGSFSISNQDNILESYVRQTIPNIDHILIREPVSFRDFGRHFEHSGVHMVPDAVFIEDPLHLAPDRKPQFVISSSMLPLHRYRSSPHPIEHLIETIKVSFNLEPIIACIDTEDKYLEHIAKRNQWCILNENNSIDDIRSEIAHSKFILSGRYHHLIYGILEATPVIALNTTSQKITGLIELCGLDQKVHDPLSIFQNQETILQDIAYVLANQEVISTKLREKTNWIKKQLDGYNVIV